MPTNVYRKPGNKVITVYRGKEVEELLQMALQSAFESEGVTIKPAKVQRVLHSVAKSVMGGDVVLIVELLPLNSMQVRGKFKGLTYQVVNKTGTQYSRKYEKGKNPRTLLQQENRGKISPSILAWRALSPSEKEVWNKKALNKNKSGYNLFISNYLHTH